MKPRTSKLSVVRRGVKVWTFLILGLYVAACLTPAVYAEGFPSTSGSKDDPARLGIVALLLGWSLGLPGSNFSAGFPSCIPWSANWFFFAGCWLLWTDRLKSAAWLGAVAAVLALTTWATALPRLLLGYYLWHTSLLVLAIGAVSLSLATTADAANPRH